ncbi:MAG: O-antigen ligase family protein [Planctomycetota bacterium]
MLKRPGVRLMRQPDTRPLGRLAVRRRGFLFGGFNSRPDFNFRPTMPTFANSTSEIHRWLLSTTVGLTAFFGPLDISADGAVMTVGLDPVVAMKLVVAGIALLLGVHGALTSPKVRDLLQSIPVMLVFGILILVAAAGPNAISGASVPSTLINAGYVLFVATALIRLGLVGLVPPLLAGLTCSAILAWTLYIFLPRYGVFPEQLADGLVIERLGGVAHPNSVSRSVLLGLVLAMYQFRAQKISFAQLVLFCTLFASAGWFAWSRTGMLAGLAATAVLWQDRLRGRWAVSTATAAAIVLLAGITMTFAAGKEDQLVDQVISKVSKSGDAEEIKSGTGRSEIWGFAFDLIRERPIFGHGFNAAPTLMVNHSQSTHNAILHASLSGGLIAGGLMLLLMAWNLFTSFADKNMLVRATATFLVISCLMEETVLETFPGPCTLLWLLCTTSPCLYAGSPRVNAGRASLSSSATDAAGPTRPIGHPPRLGNG